MKANPAVAEWKRDVVNDLVEALYQYPAVGLLDISGLPAAQFQKIKQKLRGQADIIVAKSTLIRLSLERAAEKDTKLKNLLPYVSGQSALIFSRLNPFKLNNIMKENKTNAPAKPGSISSIEIVVPAGDLDLPPGPVVGELQRVGIKARIQAGKVVVLEDCRLVGAGEVISKEIADVLPKLGIMPVELGLKMRAAYEAGIIFSNEVLNIDKKQIIEQFELAQVNAFNLAINVNYPTKATIGVMMLRANIAAKNLALNAQLPVREIMPMLLSKATLEMFKLATILLTKDEKSLDNELKSKISIQS